MASFYIPNQQTTNSYPATSQEYLNSYNSLAGLVPVYNDEAQKQAAIASISKQYNDLVNSTIEDFDRRGMLGSGAFAKYITNNANYGLGQGLASYQGQAEANANTYNLQRTQQQQAAMQSIMAQQQAAQNAKTQQDQFKQQMLYSQQQQDQKNQLAQDALKQQKINANRAAGKPDWW